MQLDENQLRYKRVYDISEDRLNYKLYLVGLILGSHVKRIVIRACCKQEITDTTKHKIKFIKKVKS